MDKCHVVLRIPQDLTRKFLLQLKNHKSYSVVLQESSGILGNPDSPAGICGGLRSTANISAQKNGNHTADVLREVNTSDV